MPISTPQKQDPDLGFVILAFLLAGKSIGLRELFLLSLIESNWRAVGITALQREIARIEKYDLIEVTDYGTDRHIKVKGWLS